jgi:hypothetical protein
MNERRKRSGDSEWHQRIASRIQTRIDLLFTMSENTHGTAYPGQCMRSDVSRTILVEAFSNFNSIWWSQTGSNRRPHACKARALPAELWPRNQKTNAPHSIKVVGLGRLELPTSRLSSARSNQLSYKPLTLISCEMSEPARAQPARAGASHSAQPLARVRPRRKRNVDGEIPPMELNDLAIDWPLNVSKTIR